MASRKTVHVTEGKPIGAASSSPGRRGKTIYFLLTYDRSERRLVNMERFRDNRVAAETYGERERQFADRPHIEVVLLGADSERAIRVTHPTYFEEDLSLDGVADRIRFATDRAAG
ncbi:MAG: hypothetical protein OXG69_17505 [bacterium]|nr:hypothetical protein [bacterium]